MTVDIYIIMVIIVGVVIVLSIIAVTIALWALWNGSIERYKQQRDAHYERFYRIQKELNDKRQ